MHLENKHLFIVVSLFFIQNVHFNYLTKFHAPLGTGYKFSICHSQTCRYTSLGNDLKCQSQGHAGTIRLAEKVFSNLNMAPATFWQSFLRIKPSPHFLSNNAELQVLERYEGGGNTRFRTRGMKIIWNYEVE